MKTVLILAYYFPPLGMGGTQRTAKFVKYLPQFGWQPIVITVKDVAYHATDFSLLEDVKFAQVVRSGSLDPQRLLKIFFPESKSSPTNGSSRRVLRALNRLLSWIFIPDTKWLWLPFAVLKARKLIRRQKVDCVLTTAPPHSVHLAGVLLKKLTGLPLAVDFRDGWSGGNFQNEPTAFHRWLNRKLETYVLKSADGVIAVSQRLTEKLRSKMSGNSQKFFTITNGFDSDDFIDAPANLSAAKFTITYCGAVTAMAPLEGFWAGLDLFLRRHPEARSEIEVKLIGQKLVENVFEPILKFSLEEVVGCLGYLPHRDVIPYLRQSQLLLYPIADWASDDFIPGKTFEYLAAGAPVLALGPQTEGVKILQKYGSVEMCAHTDAEAIAGVIAKYFALFKAGMLRKQQNPEVQQFGRKCLSGRLAEVLAGMMHKS